MTAVERYSVDAFVDICLLRSCVCYGYCRNSATLVMICLSDNNTSSATPTSSLLSRVQSAYRSLLYFWSPSETSFAKVEDVPNYIDKVSMKFTVK